MLVALLLPKLLDRMPDRRVMLLAAVAMVAALAVTTLLWTTAPERVGWATLLPAWAVLGMAYAGLVTPGGRLLRRSAQTEDLPSLFAAQFSLSHVCLGLLAAWRAWPKDDLAVLPHDHVDLAADHPHWKADAVDDAAAGHGHAYVIDDLHTRWPA